jgi:hypothetical protein
MIGHHAFSHCTDCCKQDDEGLELEWLLTGTAIPMVNFICVILLDGVSLTQERATW